jgi:hypothetical protein
MDHQVLVLVVVQAVTNHHHLPAVLDMVLVQVDQVTNHHHSLAALDMVLMLASLLAVLSG